MNRQRLFRMAVCALGAATLCTSTWAAKAPPTAVEPTWKYVSLGSDIGGSSMVSATVGNVTEVYATARNDGSEPEPEDNGYYWYALTRASNSLADGLKQVFVSEEFFRPIVQLRVAKAGAEQRIVLALDDGTIVQYDAVTKQVKDRSAGPCATTGSQTAFSTGDLNGDGTDEFLSICGDSSLVVHGPSYTPWSLAGVSGTGIALGQMDKDGAIELVSTSGQVIDTRAKAVQWTQSECLGSHLVAGDIDADGRDELLCGRSGEVRAYDVEKKLLKWTLPTRQNIASLQLADITGDGVRELLVGDVSELHAYDPANLADVGHLVSPTPDVTNLLVADTDGDGISELLWGAGRNFQAASFLFVSTWSTKQIDWRSLHLSQHFAGPAKGDLDGDGIDELVFASVSGSDGVNVGGRIFVLDSRTLAIRGISSVPGDVHDLRLSDVDGNGRLEILTAGSAITAHRFTRKNAFIQTASASTNDAAQHGSIAIADLDGDGRREFIAGSYDGYVDAFDPFTGGFKWRSPVDMGGGWIMDLAIGDFDKDGQLDFAAMGLREGLVHVHDGKTHAVKAVLENQAEAMVAVERLAGPNLMLGIFAGDVQEFAYQDGTYKLIDNWHAAPRLNALAVAPNGVTWVSNYGELSAFSSGHKLRYTSVDLGGPISRYWVGRQVVRLKESGLDLTTGSRGIFALPYATR
ncbi:MAG TPA: FG-GAP-like repeat-containing protein [Ideonella sp.]|uniref:FG-GAP-like repeat-containing protein n=1 Tax=Ideonella sp. TaxID=1929293 RepID=UPI002E30E687|nr:FG-GAP-like repeat-containing protein [Ideonella sp.]HEX5684105.1 FG-GAP-like repeat-containing protein [Ideonella sp.]